jgi:alpha-tubulin suppressor-like RCC1 family protein
MEQRHTIRPTVIVSIVLLILGGCGDESDVTGPQNDGLPTVASVVITPGSATFGSLGETIQLSASARDASGNVMPDKTFTCSSSNPDRATVGSSGLVTAVANGSATITATTEGRSGTASITVAQVPVAIGAGGDFSCALRSDGAAFCWGRNTSGQLGNGTQIPSAVPVAVSGDHAFDQLIVGDRVACGITTAGVAYCWGSNRSGRLGAGLSVTTLSSSVPVLVSGGHRFENLSVGLATTCGVATDGVTYCWGNNGFGTLGDGTHIPSNVPVAVINSASLGFVTVTTGFLNTCALDGAGAAFCWGHDQGRFGNGTPGSNSSTPISAASGRILATIKAGNFYFCGLGGSGGASCWGSDNLAGELGIGSLARPAVPTAVAGGLSFTSLDPNDNNNSRAHTCGVTTTNDAWCWGSNEFGQLGGPSAERCASPTTTFDCSSRPVAVSGNHKFTSIAVGIMHVCGLTLEGNVLCWGQNDANQLGDGTTTDSPVPVLVVGL